MTILLSSLHKCSISIYAFVFMKYIILPLYLQYQITLNLPARSPSLYPTPLITTPTHHPILPTSPTPGGPVVVAWESILQEVEVDSQVHVDIAATLSREVAKPLVENTFYRKIEARKVFAHRESFESIISKAEEQLKKVHR